MTESVSVTYYVDGTGNDCYRVCLPEGICSTVSSAHLIDERKTQLLRMYPQCLPSSSSD